MFGKIKTSTPVKEGNAAVSDKGPCEKSLKITVGKEVIDPIRQEILDGFRKQATLPGFRKGKAPANLIEQKHGKAIQEETVQRATKEALGAAIKEHSLRPVGPFELQRADLDEGAGNLILEATVEVEPDFKLGSYKGISMPKQDEAVSPEEIDKGLVSIQEQMAQMVPKGEGEEKEKQLPAIDDDLAKSAGFENLEKLRTHVEAKLKEQKKTAGAHAKEAALTDELIKRHNFEVPAKLLANQAERLRRDFRARLVMTGIEEKKVDEELGKFSEKLRNNALQNVKLSFILDRIAEKESITVKDQDLLERLWKLSQAWQKDPLEVRKILDERQLWPSVISNIKQEKTMALLMQGSASPDGGVS